MRNNSRYNRYNDHNDRYNQMDAGYGSADYGYNDQYGRNRNNQYSRDQYDQAFTRNPQHSGQQQQRNSRQYRPQDSRNNYTEQQYRNDAPYGRDAGNERERYNNGNDQQQGQYQSRYNQNQDNDRYNDRNDYSRNDIGSQSGYENYGYQEAYYGDAGLGNRYDRENQYSTHRQRQGGRDGYNPSGYNENRPNRSQNTTRPEWGDQHQHQHDWHWPKGSRQSGQSYSDSQGQNRDQYDRWSGNRYEGHEQESYNDRNQYADQYNNNY